jgi:adenosine deaminase CECR1
MKKRYPEWLKGYDLVAEEDNGEATLFHAKTFLRMDSLEVAMGVELPLYLHDGESDWASVANLYDAVLLGTRRIGHGFNLFRFPHLIERVKADNICIEINPLSNQILGYLRDLRIHPASTYLRRGVDCVISSDDPLIFNYKGLSYDFWSVYMAWELDLAALKKMCKNSLIHGALSPSEKAQALASWEDKWMTFVGKAIAFLKE